MVPHIVSTIGLIFFRIHCKTKTWSTKSGT